MHDISDTNDVYVRYLPVLAMLVVIPVIYLYSQCCHDISDSSATSDTSDSSATSDTSTSAISDASATS